MALPVVEKEIRWTKRCKDPALVGTVKEVIHQVSHSKKWASQKVTDECGHTRIVKSYSLLQDRFFEHMQDAGFEDFERGERGSTAEHLSVVEYKTKKEAERLEKMETEKAEALTEIAVLEGKMEDAQGKADAAIDRMNELAPKLKNIEDLARKYTDDADKVLPEAGALESAKTYREKKARPLFGKLIKVLRGLYRTYLDLKDSFRRLQENHERLEKRFGSLNEAFHRVTQDNRELKPRAEAYDTLCRMYGEDEMAKRVRMIHEREAENRRKALLNR